MRHTIPCPSRPPYLFLAALVRALGYTPLSPPDLATPYGKAYVEDRARAGTCSVEAYPGTYGHPKVEAYWNAPAGSLPATLTVLSPEDTSPVLVMDLLADLVALASSAPKGTV